MLISYTSVLSTASAIIDASRPIHHRVILVLIDILMDLLLRLVHYGAYRVIHETVAHWTWAIANELLASGVFLLLQAVLLLLAFLLR